MDQAKAAINKLTGQHGHHTTEVHEHYKPAVTHEQVNKTQEHRDTTVVDNEVHQEHHHTSVLPVQHTETLPTQHTHTLGEAKHTTHHHGDHEGIHSKVKAEAAQFQDKRVDGGVEKSHSVQPSIAGEHHHHHVHETIQPVIQKQTIQPSVVHHTIPVHEVHHNEPKHYTASALPAVSLDEFKNQGGSLTGLADRVERFEGEPENIANAGSRHGTTGTTGTTGTSGLSGAGTTSGLNDTTRSTTGTTGSGIDSRVDRAGAGTTPTGVGATGTSSGLTHNDDLNHTGSHGSTGKPSLLQKLNPFTDADGDGKKGMMK